jgi:mono/diheme cytochrome c family protein
MNHIPKKSIFNLSLLSKAVVIGLLFNLNASAIAQDNATSMADTTAVADQGPSSEELEAEKLAEGKSLFTTYCKACHNIDMRLVGPPLKGVTERRDKEWIYSFVKASQSMVEAGDSTAVALWNEYNKVPMPNQPVTNEQIDLILSYVESAGKPTMADNNRIPRPEVTKTSSIRPMKFTDFRFWITFTITVLLLIAVVYFKAETEALRKQGSTDGEE